MLRSERVGLVARTRDRIAVGFVPIRTGDLGVSEYARVPTAAMVKQVKREDGDKGGQSHGIAPMYALATALPGA